MSLEVKSYAQISGDQFQTPFEILSEQNRQVTELLSAVGRESVAMKTIESAIHTLAGNPAEVYDPGSLQLFEKRLREMSQNRVVSVNGQFVDSKVFTLGEESRVITPDQFSSVLEELKRNVEALKDVQKLSSSQKSVQGVVVHYSIIDNSNHPTVEKLKTGFCTVL